MATIKFLIQSKSKNASVYIRLSLGREKTIKRKTGLVVDSSIWNKKKGFPKDTTASGKAITTSLKKLEGHVFQNYNIDNSSGVLIDGDWLTSIIEKFFGRKQDQDFNYLLEYTEYFIENLPSRVNRGKVGVTKSTTTKYKTLRNKIQLFENHHQKKTLLKLVNSKFRDEFIKFLKEEQNINDNTIGRYIVGIKTIVTDARSNGYEVSPQINDYKGFSVKPPIVTLSFKEIDKLKELNLTDKTEQVVRDWFIIGCYTGQRISDLLRMNKSMIVKVRNFRFIELKQKKTGKKVQIPIHQEVEKVLSKRKGDFPKFDTDSINSQKIIFNRLIKIICKKAQLDDLTQGNLTNSSTNRRELGKYPKWKLVTSHACRRSFCTNFYALKEYPTPLLMYVSGHQKESVFLSYIGKEPIDFAIQLAEIWAEKN